MVKIDREGLPPAWIRDQQPMPPRELEPLLDGMSVEEWYRLINSKVFFWAEWWRLEMLLGAKRYRGAEHVVLKVDAQKLISKASAATTLTSINSGSTYARANGEPAPRRGRETFQPIAMFGDADTVAEVAVEWKVDDILSLTQSAGVWTCSGWRNPAALVRPLWPN
jgi:hypothetical protein